MDLPRLFLYQSQLNNQIRKARGLKGGLIDTQRLALLVEIAELCNAWREFKVWRADRSPRRPEMLEEYSDCLHFFASMGLMLGVDPKAVEMQAIQLEDTITQFQELFRRVAGIKTPEDWEEAFRLFLGFRKVLGISQEEIERAHMEKHRINYKRLGEEVGHVYQ